MKDVDLQKQIVIWYRASVIFPAFTTITMISAYVFDIADTRALFIIACGLYFFTAIIWWWWTMKNLRYLTRILRQATYDINSVTNEVKSIKEHFKKSEN
jgi:hypothetical protein